MFKKKKKLTQECEEETDSVVAETPEEKFAAEAICPDCAKPVTSHKCRLCGATKSISPVSGNVIWMRNGRVVAAFRDSREAYVKMAERSGIPMEEWPKQFQV